MKPMNRAPRLKSALSSVVLTLLIVTATVAASSANYALNWSQIGAGGGEGSHSASYHFSSMTVGQGIAGNSQSQSYAFAAGYQQDFTPPQPTNTPGGPTSTPRPTFTPIATYTPAPTATATDCPNHFVDVSGNVFYGAIHYLACHNVVNGTDSTHYSPAGTSTRGQFAKVVVLGFGTPFYTPSGTQDFSDVPATYFAYLYIESGFHAGVLSGFDAASCQAAGQPYPCYLPNRAITRAQLTKLVVNAAHYPLYTPSGGQQTFTDVPPSNVFFGSIETAAHKLVVNGYPDHTFRPNNVIRRDEMAQIVYKGVTTP